MLTVKLYMCLYDMTLIEFAKSRILLTKLFLFTFQYASEPMEECPFHQIALITTEILKVFSYDMSILKILFCGRLCLMSNNFNFLIIL